MKRVCAPSKAPVHIRTIELPPAVVLLSILRPRTSQACLRANRSGAPVNMGFLLRKSPSQASETQAPMSRKSVHSGRRDLSQSV
jgi:hypothetical protein